MNILLLTKSKEYTCKLLRNLIIDHNIIAVVSKNKEVVKNTELEKICFLENIPLLDNDEMYRMIEEKKMPLVDLAISNTFGRLIRKPLLEWTQGNCINLHGAILPDYKGLFPYNHGLLNGEKEWGVTAHYVNEKFDQGDIIKIKKFPICAEKISVKELEEQTQRVAYELTMEIVKMWKEEGPLPAQKQEKGGRYYSREDFERAKEVYITDSAELVQRKIHAFWCPPYEGAYIKIGEEHFQLLPLERENG